MTLLIILLLAAVWLGRTAFFASPQVIAFRLYVAAHPNEPGARYELAKSYYEAGYYHQAIGQYLQALRLKPDSLDSLWMLALAYDKSGEPNKAAQTFALYLEKDSTSDYAAYARSYIESMASPPASEPGGASKGPEVPGRAAP
jgi:tetratricopeptide (TPR) repeat protein